MSDPQKKRSALPDPERRPRTTLALVFLFLPSGSVFSGGMFAGGRDGECECDG